MKLVDTNVWLALALSGHIHHETTQAWLALPSTQALLFCRATQQSLLRLLTTAAVMHPHGIAPLTNAAAWSFYSALLTDRRISFADEPRGVESYWQTLATRDTSSPKLWMDAYLAAFALAGGYQLVTTDHAFQQFAGLDVLVLNG